MLLKGLLRSEGVEKELPALLILLVPRSIADILRHVISPFLVEPSQAFEFLLKFGVVTGWLLQFVGASFLLQHGVGLEFLLNDVSQLEGRGLQNLKALLQLGCKHLLHRQILELMQTLGSHRGSRNLWRKLL